MPGGALGPPESTVRRGLLQLAAPLSAAAAAPFELAHEVSATPEGVVIEIGAAAALEGAAFLRRQPGISGLQGDPSFVLAIGCDVSVNGWMMISEGV